MIFSFKKTKFFIYASSTLIGYVIGAGIFGLPFVMQRIGFFPALLLLIFLGVSVVLNCLSLVEVVLRTPGEHYLPGLAGIYLGKLGKIVQSFSFFFSAYGAVLAYIILGGVFLKELVGLDFDVRFFGSVFLALGALLVLKGFEELGVAEIFMSATLLLIILVLGIVGLDKVDLGNLGGFFPERILLAFGVMLFSLDGLGAIIVIRQGLLGQERFLKPAIWFSYLVIILVFIIFSWGIVGSLGSSVSREGIVGLKEVFGNSFSKIAVIFGFLAIFSSLVVVGSGLEQSFLSDFKSRPFWAWFLFWIIPLFFYWAGVSNFIAVISLVGAVSASLNTLLIALMLKQSRKVKGRKPEFQLKTPLAINFFIAGLYFVGLFWEGKEFIASLF